MQKTIKTHGAEIADAYKALPLSGREEYDSILSGGTKTTERDVKSTTQERKLEETPAVPAGIMGMID